MAEHCSASPRLGLPNTPTPNVLLKALANL